MVIDWPLSLISDLKSPAQLPSLSVIVAPVNKKPLASVASSKL